MKKVSIIPIAITAAAILAIKKNRTGGSIGYPEGLQLEFPFEYDAILDFRDKEQPLYSREQARADIDRAYEDMRTYLQSEQNRRNLIYSGYKDSITSDIWPANTLIEIYVRNIYQNENYHLALTIEGDDLRDATATIERTIKKAQRFGYEVNVYQDGNLILTA